jgi:hypothetical protein
MTDYNGNFTYYPSNYNRLFNDKSFINKLLNTIRLRLGRQINRSEKMTVISILKNINPVIFKSQPMENILKVLSDTVTEQIVKFPCRGEDDPNIHEILKGEIGVSTEHDGAYDIKPSGDFADQITSSFANQVEIVSLLGYNTAAGLQSLINPTLIKKKVYILLDTRYRILDTDGTTSFQWNVVNTEITQQGSVNVIGNIRDIVAIRIFPIKIPYNSNADNDYSRVTLLIQEFSAQSFIAQENRRFHFMLRPVVTDRWIELTTDNFNDGYFIFRNPITRLDTLTLTFGSPLDAIKFDTDRMNAYINDADYSTDTTFTTNSPHNLETGDTAIISNFRTANSAIDTVMVSLINRAAGHIITYIDANRFSIDVNSSAITSTGAGTVSVTNGSPVVDGVGTAFGTYFFPGDSIEISGVKYSILSIQSQTSLTLRVNYAGVTAAGLTYKKNNIVNGLQVVVYFASKRIFIPIEIEYYASEETKSS